MNIRRIATVLLAAAIPAFAQSPADGEQTLAVGAATRTYRLHVPAGAPSTPLALVVVFHGGGGNARNAARMSGMDAKADKEKFIVVYPNGSGPMSGAFLTWNTWQCCGYALDNHVDDIAFIRAMVEDIARTHAIDRRRVFATGMSNGGMMAYRVGCEMADVFAAIAPVAGALDTDSCKPSGPVSLIAFHGKADEHVRFDGGVPIKSVDRRHARVDKPVSYAIDFWKRANRCDEAPARDQKGNVTHEAYACGATSTAVELYAFDGQGHSWPGSATDLMWDFFSRHPRK
ncbi:MAG TPA: PHB depolymerase family esterase [Usitatibacter sp.]|jgi:polyhydroxybutyrate depolymerase